MAKKTKDLKSVLAIDPGKSGAIVWLSEKGDFSYHPMPVDDEGLVDFDGVHEILDDYSFRYRPPIFLERAVSFGMGLKGAFNYGRGFEAVMIAIALVELPVTLVEPGKWAKVMHQGINAKYKPKEKSLIALKRLYPKLMQKIPASKKGKLHDGVVDAILIAGYGLKGFGL